MRTSKQQHVASLAAMIVAAYGPTYALASHHEQAGAEPKKGTHAVVKPSTEIQWSAGPASLPPGAKAAVLEGDPSKDGMFTVRIKMPAGYVIPPHTHPKIERVTVLSGELGLGMGPDFDESKLVKMPEGSFFLLEPGMQHFVQAAEEAVVQLNAIGPWGITYVRASDDPRNQPQARKGPAEAGASRKP
jgi:quercetin dioxygenase-like cupin family protein